MIIVIVLLVYIAFGALINTLMLDLNFIDGLYFTVVTIETIGFGDIVPRTTGARIFACFYIGVGVITIGLFVAMVRETVLEALELGYRKRVRGMRARRRDAPALALRGGLGPGRQGHDGRRSQKRPRRADRRRVRRRTVDAVLSRVRARRARVERPREPQGRPGGGGQQTRFLATLPA